MAYSCSDFTDDIMRALGITVDGADPDEQAHMALAAIERLRTRASRTLDGALVAIHGATEDDESSPHAVAITWEAWEEEVTVTLTRAQSATVRSLIYAAIKDSDDPIQDDELNLLVSQFEEAEEN